MKIFKKICFFIILLFVSCLHLAAQKKHIQSSTMNYGENISYDIYFKWGFMARAGDAVFYYDKDNSVDNATSRYRMSFKTTKLFDGFFKMRDTLSCYYNNDNKIIFSKKATDEGNYYSVDELTFDYGEKETNIHSLRYNLSRVRIDTVLTTTDSEITDLLGAIYYIRGINRNDLQHGDVFPVTVAIGRDLVKIQFIYQNQSIVERGKVKYNTRYFKIDIFDDAFESTKTSAEVWVGDDDNFFPIKARTKLKIGYAEIYYKSSSNLAHPLKCRIEIRR